MAARAALPPAAAGPDNDDMRGSRPGAEQTTGGPESTAAPAAARRVPDPLGLTAAGNHAVARLMSGVSRPSDEHEVGASRVAARAEPVAAAAPSPPPVGLDPDT